MSQFLKKFPAYFPPISEEVLRLFPANFWRSFAPISRRVLLSDLPVAHALTLTWSNLKWRLQHLVCDLPFAHVFTLSWSNLKWRLRFGLVLTPNNVYICIHTYIHTYTHTHTTLIHLIGTNRSTWKRKYNVHIYIYIYIYIYSLLIKHWYILIGTNRSTWKKEI